MTLPYDYSRCLPTKPDNNCRNCLRWADMPGQTWGPRTPMVYGRVGGADPKCDRIPNNNKEST